ncbi:MAG TPA: TetR/AcrR family transcriptional regulator, partial [Patescibacteria group bacterium]|nr:TetR/AcrR family transcriptional regulator [Patescibacteria group bacterium]
MPRRRLTEEQIEAMRKRILDVALDILHDSGPEAISIRTISSKLGISHMAIYTYFNNRSELIHALNERLQVWLRGKYEKIMEEAEAGNVKTVLES